MTKGQFFVMALVCAFETYFFNLSLMEGSYFLALFWGFLLLRDTQRAYNMTKITQAILSAATKTKKKD